MANRNILLLFCGLFLLALIQPSLQGGKCVLQVSLAIIFAASITDLEQVHFFLCVFLFVPQTPKTELVIKSFADVYQLQSISSTIVIKAFCIQYKSYLHLVQCYFFDNIQSTPMTQS